MKKNIQGYILPIALISVILILDQTLKFYIKTHFYIGEEVPIFGNWFVLNFIENEGMAFGMTFGGKWGKLTLSIFRIMAASAIFWYLITLIKSHATKLLIVCISLIFAGAFGNIIDGCFYGMLFSESYYHVAEFLPEGGGYAPFMFGKVVDMLYLPIIDTSLPEWIPIWGGNHFQFFRPIFNVADSSISIGVMLLIIQQLFFSKKSEATTSPKI